MKRIFTLLLALVMCVALFACGEEPCTAHTDQPQPLRSNERGVRKQLRDLVLIIPQTPQFEDTKLYIDGVLQ